MEGKRKKTKNRPNPAPQAPAYCKGKGDNRTDIFFGGVPPCGHEALFGPSGLNVMLSDFPKADRRSLGRQWNDKNGFSRTMQHPVGHAPEKRMGQKPLSMSSKNYDVT